MHSIFSQQIILIFSIVSLSFPAIAVEEENKKRSAEDSSRSEKRACVGVFKSTASPLSHTPLVVERTKECAIQCCLESELRALDAEHAKVEYQRKIDLLNRVRRELSKKYIGFESAVESLMSVASRALLDADGFRSPVIIPLFSFPGQGKTSLVKDWVNMMGLEDRFIYERIRDNSRGLPVKKLLQLASQESRIKSPIDAVVLWDEFQKMQSFKAGDPGYDSLWELLGNGEISDDTVAPLSSHLKEMDKFGPQIEAKKAKMSGILKEIANLTRTQQIIEQHKLSKTLQSEEAKETEKESSPAKTPLQNSGDELLIKRQQLERSLAGGHEEKNRLIESMTRWAQQVLEHFPAVLAFSSSSSALEIAQQLFENFATFSHEIRQQQKHVSDIKTVRPKKSVFIITANPPALVDEVRASAPADISPEQLIELVEKLNPKERMTEWIKSKCGDNAPMLSRLQVESWHFIPPFSTAQWKKIIRSALENESESVSRRLSQSDVKAHLTIHESLVEVVALAAMRPLEGLRSLQSSIITLISPVLLDFESARQEGNFEIGYSTSTKNISIIDTSTLHQVTSRFYDPPQQVHKEIPGQKKRLSLYQSSFLVAGWYYFPEHQLPASLEPLHIETISHLERLWNYNPHDRRHKLAMVYTLLAGVLAQTHITPEDGHLEFLLRCRSEALRLLQELKHSIHTQLESTQLKAEDILSDKSLLELSKDDSDDCAKAMDLINKELLQFVQFNQSSITALAHQLFNNSSFDVASLTNFVSSSGMLANLYHFQALRSAAPQNENDQLMKF